MQREKLYNLHKTACFSTALFAFKMVTVLEDQILTVRRCYFYLTQDESVFLNFIFLHLFCVSCRAFHAAYCDVFCWCLNEKY